jgi:hypothetical protein
MTAIVLAIKVTLLLDRIDRRSPPGLSRSKFV